MRLLRPAALLAALGLIGLATAFPAKAQSADPAEMVAKWRESAHADAEAEAFTHWNEEGAVPTDCATCHAGAGFRDFHGLDGTAAGVVDAEQPTGGVIDCDTCHAPGAAEIASITFPSGLMVEDIGKSATCMTCHQGRESGLSVEEAVASLDDDAVSADLSFINPHYSQAAATRYGTVVKGGYEYDGKDYAGFFEHKADFQTCTDCHDPHALEVAVTECAECHKTEDVTAIRVSETDFDGDGDTSEGISAEVAAMHEELGAMIASYAGSVAGTAIVYSDANYPYFFNDTNGNGSADPDEAAFPNRYASWTPRLLKAAYNYQFVSKDHGAFSHNPHYVMQIMYDSIEDLAQQTGTEMPGMQRP